MEGQCGERCSLCLVSVASGMTLLPSPLTPGVTTDDESMFPLPSVVAFVWNIIRSLYLNVFIQLAQTKDAIVTVAEFIKKKNTEFHYFVSVKRCRHS